MIQIINGIKMATQIDNKLYDIILTFLLTNLYSNSQNLKQDIKNVSN